MQFLIYVAGACFNCWLSILCVICYVGIECDSNRPGKIHSTAPGAQGVPVTRADRPTSVDGSRRSWSLTLWLTFFNAISAFLLISLIATLLYLGLAAQLRKLNHHYLHDEVRMITELMRNHGEETVVAQELESHAGDEYVKHYIRLMDRHERVILESPGIETVLPAHAFPIPQKNGRPGVDRSWQAADGRVILSTTVWVDLHRDSGEQGVLQVALDVTNVEEILVSYRKKIYLLLSLGFLLCIAVSFCIARRGTRALQQMTDMVRRITVTNLEERISGRGWPRELNRLADAMNLMMNRLEDSFSRLYTSATNLSHKMRTPLTIMRGEAEVALSRRRSVEELEDVIASSLEEVTRLMRLGENILFLANAEMGKFQMERSVVNSREEAEAVVEYYFPSAEEKGIVLKCEGEASLLVDPALFCKSVSALVSNAITYNKPGGSVLVSIRQRGSLAGEISVTDTGCGIAQQEVVKIFDRFYRIYGTRHMDPHGTGLGLPIAKAIMDLHNGSIAVQSNPGEGTTVTLSFAAPFPAPSSPVGGGNLAYPATRGWVALETAQDQG